MKKFLLILCALLALLCVLAACEEEAPAGQTPAEQPPAEQTPAEQTPAEHTHAWGEWETVTAATCTAEGAQKRSCACGEVETKVLAVAEHQFTAKTMTADYLKTVATCLQKATYYYKCAGCAAKGTAAYEGESTAAHNFAEKCLTAEYAQTQATCQTVGVYYYKCTGCSAKGAETFETEDVGTHSFVERCTTLAYQLTAPACDTPGVYYYKCAYCAEMGTQTYQTATLPHTSTADLTCSVCMQEVAYHREGNTVYFGKYPQAQVMGSALIATLNAQAGALPVADEPGAWTSYGYYAAGAASDYMWYVDLVWEGVCYRGVYFTQYRPEFTTDISNTSHSYQDDNGYHTGTVYWFKYEPIAWTVLEENDGKVLLLCNMILDAQVYQSELFYENGAYYTNANGAPTGTYANNYEYSAIRAWLNETFYETAFSEMQQALIEITAVDNSAASTLYADNCYVCETTNDKLFLFSNAEAVNPEYGFRYSIRDDDARKKQTTAYAQAMGVYSDGGEGPWWLRSPGFNKSYPTSDSAFSVYSPGGAWIGDVVTTSASGVVPALWIRL